MSKQQFKGRTTAEAAIKACEAMGVTRSELKYTLVSDSGEGMARLVIIEAEASAQTQRAPAPPRSQPDAAPAAEASGSYGYGAPAPAREATGLHRSPPSERSGGGRGRERPSANKERGGRNAAPTSGVDGEGAHAAPTERAPRAERAERAPRSERPERPERAPRGGRSAERAERPEAGARAPAETSERPRRGENERGRRRGGEGRAGGRSRHDGQDRNGQEGIDSLLSIEPISAPVARHPSVAPTSPRAKRSLSVVADILRHMGIATDVVLVSENEAEVHVHLYGEHEAQIIGKKGEVLLALQFVVNRILSRGEDEGEQVVVLDAGGYRERRQKALEALAKTLAERSVKVRKAVRLSPMSAHDRRIFHMVLKDITTVGTRSEGDGLYRHLLIIPAEFC